MKIYRKTYGVRNLVEWQANIPVGKGRLIVHFTGGSITAYGVTPAVYKTDNPIHQAIIENSGYFRSGRIFLMKSDFLKEIADPAPKAPAKVETPAPAPAPTVETKQPEKPAKPAKAEKPASITVPDPAPATTPEPEAPAETPAPAESTAPAAETAATVVTEPAKVETPAPAPAGSEAGDGPENNVPVVVVGEDGITTVKVNCFEDARQYLITNFGFTPSAVRSKALAKSKAGANKVKFIIDGNEL